MMQTKIQSFISKWRSGRLFRNIAYSVFDFTVFTLLTLVSTPLLISKMGAESYGLWVTSLSFLGLAGFIDMGTGAAVLKYVAEFVEKKDIENISLLVSVAYILNFGLGILGVVGFSVFTPVIAANFGQKVSSQQEIIILLQVLRWGVIPLMIDSVSLGIIRGYQVYRISSIISSAQNIINILIVMLIAYMGGSIKDILAVTVTLKWIWASMILLFVLWMLHKDGAYFQTSFDMFKKILGFSLYAGATSIGIKIFSFADRLTVAYMLGFTASGYYSIATGIANRFANLSSTLTQASMPAFSAWQVNLSKNEIWNRLMRLTAIVGMVTIIPGLFLLIFSRVFLNFWLGTDVGEAVNPIMQILVFIYMIRPLSAPSYQALLGLGHPWATALTAMAGGLGTILLIILLSPHFGIIGAAWANIVGWVSFGLIGIAWYYLKFRA